MNFEVSFTDAVSPCHEQIVQAVPGLLGYVIVRWEGAVPGTGEMSATVDSGSLMEWEDFTKVLAEWVERSRNGLGC